MPAIRIFSITDAQIYQEYQIGSISSASAPQLLAFNSTGTIQNAVNQSQIVILEARGDNVIFNFGGSGVTASKTLTGNALPRGNFSVPEGTIFSTTVNGATQNYVSCITENSGGTGIVRLATINL